MDLNVQDKSLRADKISSNVVAVVPARSGSKGLIGKNIIDLKGKPLIAYTAEAALGVAQIDRLILSTDSEEIAEIGKSYGMEVPFLRPRNLATDTSPTVETIDHVVRYLEETEGYPVELIVTLQPTSPLRTPNHIYQSLALIENDMTLDSVITVTEVGHPPFWMLRKSGTLLIPFINDNIDYSKIRRQDLETIYQPNGAVYVTRRSLLRENEVLFSSFINGNTGFVVMDTISSIDIDSEADLIMAEMALSKI